jgi:hypothetical protein
MLLIKPFLRIIILSLLLFFLLVYLGIKYHWGDHFRNDQVTQSELQLPLAQNAASSNPMVSLPIADNSEAFIPEIIKGHQSSSLIVSMNKEQIEEQCTNLLSKTNDGNSSLELAVANCVISNFQETYENSSARKSSVGSEKNLTEVTDICTQKISQLASYSSLEKQLLIGICVSDQSSH